MPSIRRLLILYFLSLMGVSLAVVGLFVRHEVAVALNSRAAADATRIRASADTKSKTLAEQFDKELGIEARTLVRDFFREYGRGLPPANDPGRLSVTLLPLGFTQSALSREIALALATSRERPFGTWREQAFELWHEPRREFNPGEHTGGAVFQITIPPRLGLGPTVVWTPPNQGPDLPVGAALEDGEPRFDDAVLEALGLYRLVTLRGGPRGPGPRVGGSVVYGRSRAKLDDQLVSVEADCRAELAELPANAAADLSTATGTLALVATACLLLFPVGGWLLVGRGLRTLDTLTAAVSQVNERDFRLPVAASELSTELAPIHDKLTKTLDALRRAFEREKEAVGDISHELRTPLAALQTTIDVALRKPREAEFYRATLSDCRAITKQLARLVDRILTLATLDAGETPSWTPVDVADLAGECAALIRPLAEGHDVRLTVELDPRARSTTDPDKLREVLMNLLHNAVEYNRPGGEVRLSVVSGTNGVTVSVADTGIGMTPEVRAKIFERFYRADPSRHATGIHAGLGLAIVKEYVERLRGQIVVTSEPGAGSRFEVAIPAIAG